MTTLTISQKGWVVIPAPLRKKYNLTPGSKVQIVDYGGVMSIVPVLEDPISHGRGMLRDVPGLTETLLEERAKERAREDRKGSPRNA